MTIQYRDLAGLAEFRAAQQMQQTVWGMDDQPDPADLMMVVQSEGGICAGAFQGDQLVGYVFGFATRDPQVQHSHRLAVLPDWRGAGIGVGLKLYQRAWCQARGIRIMRWTYDPLITRNAHLNIARLGGIGQRYLVNYYGAEGSYQGGIDSDRIVVELHLTDRPATTAQARVSVPRDFSLLLRTDPDAAAQTRLQTRQAMTALFDQGLVITGFDATTGSYDFGQTDAPVCHAG
ncbi:GNAT family N-acetyltransferase [Pseudotabrizicola alkalilacus]|uniref:GNAT family N-acetyltransferase n=1 Tax=Pseudotabrizicola alkalilacus TaxID=2305252 RepID=A0A411YZP7_9RHOB|nr:GNAT family N-acetyltransferase [Pseudotabrizicola alkalilacus]RGP36289.1 GNAT family N-acetyltransferase [Pseudotabrizicola alkalilacus]